MKETKKKKHTFSKVIVAFSILFVVLYTIISMLLQFTVQIEPSPTLTTCVFSLFGTELAVSGLITINKKKYGCQQSEITEEIEDFIEGE